VRLAESAGDPLGVLFAAREARAVGAGAAVAEAEQRARASLGIDLAEGEVAPQATVRLAQAERWLASGADERAADELGPLFAERDGLALTPDERVRLVLAWVDCVARQDLESAARVAGSERPRISDLDARRRLDGGIARLFERHGQFERAADAYQGDY
jgi:hypothetical protein